MQQPHGLWVGQLAALGPIVHPTSEATGAWPAANRAILVPCALATPLRVAAAVWRTGSTVSGNADIGIYTPDGVLVVSTGGTAVGGANSTQIWTLGPTRIAPGWYWLAMSVDNTTCIVTRQAPALVLVRAAGVVQAGSAYPLPATLTPEQAVSAYIPSVGLLSA